MNREINRWTARQGARCSFSSGDRITTGGGVKSDVGRNQLTKPGDESGDGPCFCKPVVGNLEINGTSQAGWPSLD